MGQLAQTAQATQLAQANPQQGFKALLERSWPRIAAVMPRHMSADRMFQLAVSTYNSDPKLAECSPQSLLSCLMKCSALGLEPSNVDGLGRAYILPYRNKGQMTAQLIVGYKGYIDLARRSGELLSIHAQAVYEGDEFERWEDMEGQHFTFRPSREAPHTADRLTDVYVVAKLKGGGSVFETMTREEVEAIKKRSKAGNYGPWVTDYEAMALKTVIRRAFKYLPVSVEAQNATTADETTPDYGDVFAPVVRDLPAEAVAMEPQEEQAPEVPEGVDPETGEVEQDGGEF